QCCFISTHSPPRRRHPQSDTRGKKAQTLEANGCLTRGTVSTVATIADDAPIRPTAAAATSAESYSRRTRIASRGTAAATQWLVPTAAATVAAVAVCRLGREGR